MRRISQTDSNRLTALRFPLIVAVVLIHNFDIIKNSSSTSQGTAWQKIISEFAINLTAQGLCRLAVPIFFIISSYLLFSPTPYTPQRYKIEIAKRSKTLVIPFLFWTICVFLASIATQHITEANSLLHKQSRPPFAEGTPFELVNAIIGIDRKPVAHHFWFIRDLIILCLFSPAIYIIIKNFGLAVILPLTALWLTDSWPLAAPTLDGILFFSIGCFLACKNASLFCFDKKIKLSSALYAALLLTSIYMGETTKIGRYTHNLGILIGIPVALYLSGEAAKSPAIFEKLAKLAPYSFFVYAAHDPAIALLRRISLKLISNPNHLAVMTLYFLIPTVLIALLILINDYLIKNLPTFTKFITGGR